MYRARRSWSDDPEGPNDGDRNGEPSEADWSCLFVLVCIIAIAAIVFIALIGNYLAGVEHI